jgi:hypothetical protein
MNGFQNRPPRYNQQSAPDPSVRRLRATVTFLLSSINTKVHKDQIVGWDGYSLYLGNKQVEIQGIEGAIEKKWLVDLDDDHEHTPAPAKFNSKVNPIQFTTEDNIQAEMKIGTNGELIPKKLPPGMTMQQAQRKPAAPQRAADYGSPHQVPVMQHTASPKQSQVPAHQPQKTISIQPAPKSKFKLGSVGIDD